MKWPISSARAWERAGIPFFQRTTTNQIFAVLTEEQNAALELDFAYERWAKLEDGAWPSAL